MRCNVNNNAETHKFLMNLAIAHNFDCTWADDTDNLETYEFFVIKEKNNRWSIDCSNRNFPSETVSLWELVKFIETTKQEELLMIRGDVVEFRDNGDIKVGCQVIPYDKVQKIAEMSKEKLLSKK